MVRSPAKVDARRESVWESECQNFVFFKESSSTSSSSGSAGPNKADNTAAGSDTGAGAIRSSGRRPAISSSELGLYFDRSDIYSRNFYGTTVRKFVYSIMVVMSIVLLGIFLYDFASSASSNSKMSQESKHLHILQNSLKKGSRRLGTSTASPAADAPLARNHQYSNRIITDRSDIDLINPNISPNGDFIPGPEFLGPESEHELSLLESREQNLKNFKMRNQILQYMESAKDREPGLAPVNNRQHISNNHAMIYRMSRSKIQKTDDEQKPPDSEPQLPIRLELRGSSLPPPYHKFPQLSQYRYPHATRSFQDIIKYLTDDPQILAKGIKFSGYYVSPKEDSPHQDSLRGASNNVEQLDGQDRASALPIAMDPLVPFRPLHPSDVNLLASSNLRFAPVPHRYAYDKYYRRPGMYPMKTMPKIPPPHHYPDGTVVYPTLVIPKRKPKPFSVMLDIYPITDMDHSKSDRNQKSSGHPNNPNYDKKRKPEPYYQQDQPKSMAEMTEEEKQQILLHLNLFPKRKQKYSRKEIIQKSLELTPEQRLDLFEKIAIPLESLRQQFFTRPGDEVNNSEDDEEARDSGDLNLPNDESQELKESSLTHKVRKTRTMKKEDIADAGESKHSDAENVRNTTDFDLANANQEVKFSLPEFEHDVTSTTIATTTLIPEAVTVTNKTTTSDIDTIEGFEKFVESIGNNQGGQEQN